MKAGGYMEIEKIIYKGNIVPLFCNAIYCILCILRNLRLKGRSFKNR
jgi:hypothetical protein